MKRIRKELALLLIMSMLLSFVAVPMASAAEQEAPISSGTTYVLLYLNKKELS